MISAFVWHAGGPEFVSQYHENINRFNNTATHRFLLPNLTLILNTGIFCVVLTVLTLHPKTDLKLRSTYLWLPSDGNKGMCCNDPAKVFLLFSSFSLPCLSFFSFLFSLNRFSSEASNPALPGQSSSILPLSLLVHET